MFKKIVLTLAASLACTAAFASLVPQPDPAPAPKQGEVILDNTSGVTVSATCNGTTLPASIKSGYYLTLDPAYIAVIDLGVIPGSKTPVKCTFSNGGSISLAEDLNSNVLIEAHSHITGQVNGKDINSIPGQASVSKTGNASLALVSNQ